MKLGKLELLDNQLYVAIYGMPKKGNVTEIWDSIKSDQDLLKEAIKVKRNKWNTGDLVCSLAICDALLVDFRNVDREIYQELINTIYSNRDIARICIDHDSGDSFLLMSLWNFDLKLTEEQKAFAVSEAMNMPETVGVREDATNAHGRGDFDIRYWILRNPNWTIEEKQKLIMEFWVNDDDYDETLEQWEWGVVNDKANYQGEPTPPFDRYDLFYTTDVVYEYLLDYHKDKATTDRLWDEIQFCKKMHELRPMQWETSKVDIRAQITVTNDRDGQRMAEIEQMFERLAQKFGFSVTVESSNQDTDKDSDTVVYQKKFPLK